LLGFLRLQSAILERNAAKLDAAKLAAAWRTWLTGNIDTHVCGIVRVLVGSVSLVAGRLREVSEGVGNSVEEGAISAKRGGTGRAISSFADGCLTRDQAFINFNKPKWSTLEVQLCRLTFNVFDVSQTLDSSI
jgi:hypothetical protein